MEDLNVAYANLLDDGSYLETAQAISPDGRYIVGTGYNAATGRREAYLLDTRPSRRDGDVNGDGCVDDSDLLRVLFAFGATGLNYPASPPIPADLQRDTPAIRYNSPRVRCNAGDDGGIRPETD